ncbi:hypothetical protein ACHAXR_002823 [Thalassiosira sp. AJA248-18]
MMKKFERLRHIRYFTNCLQRLPKQYSSADTTRLTLVHFCVQALDILGCLPDADCCGKVEEEVYIRREAIVEWIYGLQTLPTTPDNDDDDASNNVSEQHFVGGGFKGGTYLGPLPNVSDGTITEVETDDRQQIEQQQQHPYDHSHLAMTYVALCTLVALGDDLSRVHKTAILQTLQSLQKEDGSFVAISSNCNKSPERTEQQEDDDCDLRFMYTAIVIWYLLANDPKNNDSSTAINIQSATSYILSCISYDGALGLTPGREGHGGSTFCGIASLYLMGVLDDVMEREELNGWKDDLIRWCVMRQYPLAKSNNGGEGKDKEPNGHYNLDNDNAAGMQGRPNKLEDTCYSYWIGGTLHLLSESHLLDGWALREYVLTCQSPYGGFGKLVGAMPDLLHSFYSLSWLALSREQGCCDEDEFGKDWLDIEMRQQVCESIDQLSKLDCALGMCTKRKPAFQKGSNG